MNLSPADYRLARFAARFADVFETLGRFETRCLKGRLSSILIDRPVFVTGMARAGTTILLEMLSGADGVATARYRDFPFLFIPIAWNRFQDRYARPAPARERPHRDRIVIDRDSPEAFEEPLWRHFWPGWDAQPIDRDTDHADFEGFFRDHIRKLLWLHGGRRYVSKGNYNVTRIGYLARLFPDARFVVPVRHPIAHVRSLVRQHALFCSYAADDSRIGPYLAAAGHFEFGPQRRAIPVTQRGAWRASDFWSSGMEAAGYAAQWAEIYKLVADLAGQPDLAGRIMIVRHEDFCARPAEIIRRVLAFTGLHLADDRLAAFADRVAPSPADNPSTDADALAVWDEVAQAAARFGYWEETAAVSPPLPILP